jgi:hypothetical protein
MKILKHNIKYNKIEYFKIKANLLIMILRNQLALADLMDKLVVQNKIFIKFSFQT